MIIGIVFLTGHIGADLSEVDSQVGNAVLKQLWNYFDATMLCKVKINVNGHIISYLLSCLILLYQDSTRLGKDCSFKDLKSKKLNDKMQGTGHHIYRPGRT